MAAGLYSDKLKHVPQVTRYTVSLNGKTIRSALYWGAPSLFCLILYWRGIFVWFHDDDFAFLGLLPWIHNWRDLADAIFKPTGHGTWRPLSERVYFIGVQWLFGVGHARPFRIIAFLVQFANLALMSAITLRLTRSRLAGFAAPILWIANSALYTAMVWDCAFMYVLSSLVLMGAFWLLLRYIETGNARYYAGMWAVFLAGFLVIETNIVFPALALAYTLLCARPYLRKVLPLFVPSILFVIAHEKFIPKQSSGPYKMQLNLGMFRAFGEYWSMALNPLFPAIFPGFPQRAALAGMVIFTLTLLGFVVYQAFQSKLLPLFFLSWFGIVLAPVMPFPDHVTNYYLTLPLIGMAMLAAYAFAEAMRYRRWSAITGAALVLFFMLESVPSARGATKWVNDRSHEVKHFVMNVAEASHRYPDKLILLDGFSYDMYSAAINDSPFQFLSVNNVYLAPNSTACLVPAPEDPPPADLFAPLDRLRDATANHQLLVLDSGANQLVNVTDQYTYVTSVSVDVADPKRASQLGPTWQPAEGGFRWTLQSASLKMDGPATGCHNLTITGYCPAPQLARGPMLMTVTANGVTFPAVKVDKRDAPFTFQFPLKAASDGHYKIALALDHSVTTPPDARPLGLTFGTFEIR